MTCEMCGGPLISNNVPSPIQQSSASETVRTDSPGPVLDPSKINKNGSDAPESVKISFRRGGEKIFYERLKGSMTQRKWLLRDAPPAPNSRATDEGASDATNGGSGGERRASVLLDWSSWA
ncbi:hypothetical protein NXS19_008870 [Fusarium pseudograminearum]|nr:hypothetical protein NXS19_008870 [Fusarium pseudograminearum]